ncbi:TPA: YSIRK-type signal peptide-containing protein [Streptococcus equi subsp. zooepidemicus]|nr:YSIRK-type signal peptide-containing protein [Streptococcus equi subsp. zooepidemicus]
MFLRNNTNKQYSLRRLKKGTASVAVALAVLGVGVTTSQTVKAEEFALSVQKEQSRNNDLHKGLVALENEVHALTQYMGSVQNAIHQSQSMGYSDEVYANYVKTLNDKFEELYNKVTGVREQRILKDKITALSHDFEKLKRAREKLIRNFAGKEADMSLTISDKNKEIESLRQLYGQASQKSLESGQRVAELEAKRQELMDQVTKLENDKEELSVDVNSLRNALGNNQQKAYEAEQKVNELEAESKRQEHMYEAFMSQYKEQVEQLSTENQDLAANKAELEKQKQILEASRERTLKDLEAARNAKKEVEAEKAALEEQKQILEVSRERTLKDLEAARNAKKEVEAEKAALEEQKQILEASRERTLKDLEAARNAKKNLESQLTDAMSKLKELEDGKKLSDQEKAELQAKLEAETKALKEQIAKQAKEIAKLKEEQAKKQKEETPKAPEKPETKPEADPKADKPAKPEAKPAAPKTEAKKAAPKAGQLPSTGESANPFFTIAALTVIAGAGMAVVSPKRKEN